VNDAADRSRIAWRCRRGMLELDLLLGGFVDREYDRLSDEERDQFRRLLATPDQELLGVLLGHERPADEELIHVIEKIRRAAAH
jgi:antitoxin CptB